MVSQLDDLLASIEGSAADPDEWRSRGERLERERDELRLSDERARKEHAQTARALAELRVAYDALVKQASLGKPTGRGRRIMVVDDAQSDLRMMESILRSAGHEVLAYPDGEKLEEKVAAERPDLLLLDIVMPKRNGYEVLRALKRDERTKHMPVAIVSSRAQDSDRMWSKRQGADEYVSKPFTPEQLLAVVQQLANRRT
jgi:twitching motility two-component system response regulator PilH